MAEILQVIVQVFGTGSFITVVLIIAAILGAYVPWINKVFGYLIQNIPPFKWMFNRSILALKMLAKSKAERYTIRYDVNIILVGDGGVGKTSLVHSCFGIEPAKIIMKTEDPAHYKFSEIINEGTAKLLLDQKLPRHLRYDYNIFDYTGQNQQNLTEEMIKYNNSITSPFHRDNITMAIFVVDFFKTDDNGNVDIPDCSKPDIVRVSKNVERHLHSCEHVQALVRGTSLKNIVLFVNKSNGLSPRNDLKLSEYLRDYNTLIQKLKLLFPKCKFSCIAGSAGNCTRDKFDFLAGEGIIRLKTKMRESAKEEKE